MVLILVSSLKKDSERARVHEREITTDIEESIRVWGAYGGGAADWQEVKGALFNTKLFLWQMACDGVLAYYFISPSLWYALVVFADLMGAGRGRRRVSWWAWQEQWEAWWESTRNGQLTPNCSGGAGEIRNNDH